MTNGCIITFFKAEYVREFGKNLSYTFGFKNWKQTRQEISLMKR